MGYNIRDITKHGLSYEKASLDYLTGVLSREYINRLANYYIDKGIEFSLYIIDIDNFKGINDQFGHLAGDEVLKTIAEKILSVLPETAVMGRFGGDEFLVLNKGVTEYDDVYTFTREIYKQIRYNHVINESSVAITATTGSVSYPKNGNNYTELFMKADKALYRGKEKGRNCFIIYRDDKHGNIEIKKESDRKTFDTINDLLEIVCSTKDFKQTIEATCSYIETIYPIKVIFISCEDSSINRCPVNDSIETKYFEEILGNESLIFKKQRGMIKDTNPEIFNFFEKVNLESFIIQKVGISKRTIGYLIFAEFSISRVWQKTDLMLINYLANILYLRKNK